MGLLLCAGKRALRFSWDEVFREGVRNAGVFPLRFASVEMTAAGGGVWGSGSFRCASLRSR